MTRHTDSVAPGNTAAGKDRLSILRANPWFQGLPDAVLDQFASNAHIRELEPGELFAARGTMPPGVGVVIRGAICASSYSAEGHEFALSMLEFGELWGLAAVLDGEGLLRDNRAYGQTEVLVLARDHFLAVLDAHPVLYRHFVTLLCRRIRVAHSIIDELALRPLRLRLARILCALAQASGDDTRQATIAQTQDVLATLLGVSRPALNRELKQLQALGLVRLGYGSITLTDTPGLQRLWQHPPSIPATH